MVLSPDQTVQFCSVLLQSALFVTNRMFSACYFLMQIHRQCFWRAEIGFYHCTNLFMLILGKYSDNNSPLPPCLQKSHAESASIYKFQENSQRPSQYSYLEIEISSAPWGKSIGVRGDEYWSVFSFN